MDGGEDDGDGQVEGRTRVAEEEEEERREGGGGDDDVANGDVQLSL